MSEIICELHGASYPSGAQLLAAGRLRDHSAVTAFVDVRYSPPNGPQEGIIEGSFLCVQEFSKTDQAVGGGDPHGVAVSAGLQAITSTIVIERHGDSLREILFLRKNLHETFREKDFGEVASWTKNVAAEFQTKFFL